MLVFGPANCLHGGLMKNFVIYNFTSTIESIPRLDLLPPREIITMDEYNFDITYANYIISDESHFSALMQIMFSLYNGDDVFVAISNLSEPYINNLNESLIKFIQQRYGYNANIINTKEDIEYIDPTDGSFSLNGLLTFDSDRELYMSIKSKEILDNGKL